MLLTLPRRGDSARLARDWRLRLRSGLAEDLGPGSGKLVFEWMGKRRGPPTWDLREHGGALQPLGSASVEPPPAYQEMVTLFVLLGHYRGKPSAWKGSLLPRVHPLPQLGEGQIGASLLDELKATTATATGLKTNQKQRMLVLDGDFSWPPL